MDTVGCEYQDMTCICIDNLGNIVFVEIDNTLGTYTRVRVCSMQRDALHAKRGYSYLADKSHRAITYRLGETEGLHRYHQPHMTHLSNLRAFL